MEAVRGPIARKMDANVRIVRGTALIPGTVNTSNQFDIFVKLPTAANGIFSGFAAEDRFETGFSYTAGTDPSSVNGTTPAAPYDLSKKPIELIYFGQFKNALAAGAIAESTAVKIADTTGRVTAIGGEAASTLINGIGRAFGGAAAAANDYVEVFACPFIYVV